MQFYKGTKMKFSQYVNIHNSLNQQLVKKQSLTTQQINNLHELYCQLSIILNIMNNPMYRDISPLMCSFLEDLEFKLQDNWNFSRDAMKHSYWNRSVECSCPYLDNRESYGHHRIYSSGCNIHGYLV